MGKRQETVLVAHVSSLKFSQTVSYFGVAGYCKTRDFPKLYIWKVSSMTRCSYEADIVDRQSRLSCKANIALQTSDQRTTMMASKVTLIASLLGYTARLPMYLIKILRPEISMV